MRSVASCRSWMRSTLMTSDCRSMPAPKTAPPGGRLPGGAWRERHAAPAGQAEAHDSTLLMSMRGCVVDVKRFCLQG